MKNLHGRHIVIAGAARSGVAVALLLKQKGAFPFLSDAGSVRPEMAERLQQASIPFEEHKHSDKAYNGDFLVMSPGVPSTSPIAQHYLREDKPVYSEIEVAGWFNQSPTVAVTGSNGKTTVTSWMAHTWKTAHREMILGGNIGTAFSEQVSETAPHKTVLLEVSSFQLDHIDSFHPEVSVILNITPDHLDRYDQDFDRYARSKFGITQNQTRNDWFIYNADDPVIVRFAEELSARDKAPQILAFSTEKEVSAGAFIRDEDLILRINNEEEKLMNAGYIGLPGKHNLKNGMATALAARASEISNESIRESLRTFEGVAHRLEFVRMVDGIKYINDSKATNINAVWYALDSFETPVVLILGGRDKGNDYRELAGQIRKKVHTVVAIGEARQAIREQLEQIVPNLLEADTMKEAVARARSKAKRGEVVLMSPACASFDMFDNYEHRGNQFKEAVLEL